MTAGRTSDEAVQTRRAALMTSKSLPLIVLAVVILTWGGGPPVTKLISAPPVVGVFYRFAVSAPLLLIVLRFQGRWLSRAALKRTALPGVAFAVNLTFVFATLAEATVSVLSVIGAMQPALLLILAGPIFGERPGVRHVLWTLVGIAGAALVILGAGKEVRSSALGVGFAFGSTVSFTIFFVLTRIARSTTKIDAIEWMAGVNIWAFVGTIPPLLIFADRAAFAEFGGIDWLWLLLVSYITGVIGHVLMSWLHGYIEASRSSLYLLSMHVVAVGLAWPIHHEPVNLVQVLGGVVVLGSVGAVLRIPAATNV